MRDDRLLIFMKAASVEGAMFWKLSALRSRAGRIEIGFVFKSRWSKSMTPIATEGRGEAGMSADAM
jgi:hypothetical protein